MKLIFKSWKRFISEGSVKGKHNLKYYAFDWDDNLLYMPTKIMLLDKSGSEVEMGSRDFATYRDKIGKEEFNYKGSVIKDYAPEAFRNFRPKADNKFVNEAIEAATNDELHGPSWDAFLECLNTGSIFAIITARGHNPSAIRRAVKQMILRNLGGISSGQVYDSIRSYNEIFEKGNRDGSIEGYLRLCKFYPVSNEKFAGSMGSPEQAKEKALREFREYCQSFNEGKVIKLGFSDDDPKNVKVIRDAFAEPIDGVNMSIFYTGH